MAVLIRMLFVGVLPLQVERYCALLSQADCLPEIECVDSVDVISLLLEKKQRDIVVVAYRFTGGKGMDVLALLKEQRCDIPCLVVDGDSGEDAAVAAIRAGACNYVVRGRNAKFAPAVLQALDETQLQRENLRAERELRASVAQAGRDRAAEESIIAAIGDGIAIQDNEMRIVYQNDAHRRLVGDHVGDRCYQAYDRGDGVCSGCHMHSVLQGNDPGLVIHCIGRESRSATMEVAAFPLHDQQGRIIGGIEVARDVSGRTSYGVDECLSIRDNLTGVYNYAFYAAEVERLGKSRHFPLSVVMVDIDGLSDINKRLGRDIGDQVLRSVARLLMSVFRIEDVVARVGSDEFAVLLPNAGVEGVSAVIERFRHSLSEDPVIAGEERVGLSLGIATEQDKGDLQNILKIAGIRLSEDMAARGRLLSQAG